MPPLAVCPQTAAGQRVAKILPDGTRKRAKLFSGFLSHYFIHDRYGRPGKGKGKGKDAVEGLVGYAPLSRFACKPLPGNGRNFMVPIPRFATWDDLNLWLAEQCRKRQADVLRGQPKRSLATSSPVASCSR